MIKLTGHLSASPIRPGCSASGVEDFAHNFLDCAEISPFWQYTGFLIARGHTLHHNFTSKLCKAGNSLEANLFRCVVFEESLNVRLSSISTMVSAAAARWLPPLGSFYKVNFDVAFLSSQGRGSIGVIIRDSEGYVIGDCMVRAPHLMDSFMAKAVTGVAAFRFAADLSLQRILVEGDVLSIIRKL
ncbi:reverse transcriptase [Gossypium australe]|uniref:Reverse transcriptase n=1 Tax=Gossypium australe TaxID=47621 RepID=A0A5B6WCS4_9ROSI|nr:reverse transcriptase [Gossypium australe]